MSNSPIYLIGYMACGKTTLGEALQKAFPGLVEFRDLDHEIEREAGMPIPEIFASRGEAAFRAMESAMLARLKAGGSRRLVIGCGGGTPCHGSNLQLMLGQGTVVWLRASRERTIARLLDAPGKRPLVAGLDGDALGQFIDASLSERTPFYSRAHHSFDTSRLDNEDEIAAAVASFASCFLNPEDK